MCSGQQRLTSEVGAIFAPVYQPVYPYIYAIVVTEAIFIFEFDILITL